MLPELGFLSFLLGGNMCDFIPPLCPTKVLWTGKRYRLVIADGIIRVQTHSYDDWVYVGTPVVKELEEAANHFYKTCAELRKLVDEYQEPPQWIDDWF